MPPRPALLIAATVFWLYCAVAQTTDRTNITIGLLLPPQEPQALSLRQGVLLGVAHANQQPGWPVTVITRGALGQWGADGVEAARMATDDEAEGLIAPPSGAGSHLALQIAGRTAIPVVSLCSDSSVTQTGVPWMVRMAPRTVDEAQTLFRESHPNGPRATRWLALVPTGRPGREITRDLERAARSTGTLLVQPVEVGWPPKDLASLAQQVLTNNPDGILVWLDPMPAGAMAQALIAAGFKGKLAGPGRLRSEEFVAAAGPAAFSFVVPAPVLKESELAEYRLFAGDFRARFGREPDAMAAMSYDAAVLLIRLLREIGTRPAHEAFPVRSEQPGVTGTVAFDPQGNRQIRLQIVSAGDELAGNSIRKKPY